MKRQYLAAIRKQIAGTLVVVTALMQPLVAYGGNWHQSEQGWQYSQDHEFVKNEWISDQGLWYHLDKSGWMQTDWYQDTDGHWYYLNRSDQGVTGSMRTGWYQDADGSWYYLSPQPGAPLGSMKTGWIQDGGIWYYLDRDGRWLPLRGNAGPDTSEHVSDRSDDKDVSGGGAESTDDKDISDGGSGSTDDKDISDGEAGSTDDKDLSDGGEGNGESGDNGEVIAPEDDGTDSDGDGLTNVQEAYYRTDPNNPDTDDDDLTDGDEVMQGTAPLRIDTDGDGINDGEEVRLGTNPLLYDTDQDGLLDQEELLLGTDPCNPDTNGNGILDGDELSEVVLWAAGEEEGFSGPSVEVFLPQKNSQTVTIQREDPEISVWAPKEMPGLIGAAYEFEAEGEIEEATLTFYYPEELNEKVDFEPAIYYIDTENQELVELEDQAVDRDRCLVQSRTDHFSMYALLDKSEQAKAWAVELEAGNQEAFDSRIDVVFVLDESSSMGSNDPQKIRVEVCRDFLNSLREGDRAGIVGFSNSSRLYQSLDSNLESVSNNLSSISNSAGGTTISAGISRALEQFPPAVAAALSLMWETATSSDAPMASDSDAEKEWEYVDDVLLMDDRDDLWDSILDGLLATSSDAATTNALLRSNEYEEAAMKLIILLTDGQGTYSHTYTQTAIERGVKIYTVGLGRNYNETLLKRIAADTGAKYYHADSAEELIAEFAALTADAVDILTDSDEDGLSDYHEERIRLFNGVTIRLNKNQADTDGDGLLDGEEIVQTTDQYGRVFFKMYSHPVCVDSDEDGIPDGNDARPMVFDIAPTLVTEDKIVFNTGRTWERMQYSLRDYWVSSSNLLSTDSRYILDDTIYVMTVPEIIECNRRINQNMRVEYELEELLFISFMDVNGATMYLYNKPEELRKEIWETLVGRESKYYQHTENGWMEVPTGTEGSYWTGWVVSEYDANLSLRMYEWYPDIFLTADYATACITLGIVAYICTTLTIVAAVEVSAVVSYCKSLGVKEGFSFYWMAGSAHGPMGMYSAYNNLDDGLVKDGLGKLSGKTYRVTQENLNVIKKHLSKMDPSYANTEMLNRLETALQNGTFITGADASFYFHELKEAELMLSGMSYNQAHQAALDFYGVSNFSVYHPDVIKMDLTYWNNGWLQYWGIEH